MQPITVEKPWGEFREFAINEPATVKILSVNKGQEFSLQKHEHRGEFWRVLSGHPDVVIGDKMYKGKTGDEFTAQEDDVEILEISRGEFDEDDIVRLEDKYGRS